MFIKTLLDHIDERYVDQLAEDLKKELLAMDGKHYQAITASAIELSNTIWNKCSGPTYEEAESDGDPASENHIQWMLGQIIGNHLEDSLKARAWLGYCQGVAATNEWVMLPELIADTRIHMQTAVTELKEVLSAKISSGDSLSASGMASE